MLQNRINIDVLICLLLFVIFLKHFYFIPKYNAKLAKNLKSEEFRIEFKDRKISYFYHGYGRHSCGKGSLLIATLSRPNAVNLRSGVRKSWGKFMPSKFTHKFFIGGVQNNETLRNALNEESRKHRDIIFTDLIDSYLNLTLKMNALFQWQQFYCPKIEHFLRADEDTVLDVMRFKYWLEKDFKEMSKSLNNMVIFGDVFRNFTVLRDPNEKWYVSYEEYPHFKYPDFVHGPSFLTTPKAIKAMLEESKNHNHMPVDDAFYTGIIADAIGIQRIDLKKHFAEGNPLYRSNSSYECDEIGRPFLFSIYDEAGEIETAQGGYDTAYKKLKQLQC